MKSESLWTSCLTRHQSLDAATRENGELNFIDHPDGVGISCRGTRKKSGDWPLPSIDLHQNINMTGEKMTTSSGPPSSWTIKDVQQNSGLLPTLAVTLWLGWNGVVVGSTLYAILFASNTTRMAILGIFTLSMMLPSDFPGKLGFRLGDWIMSHAEIYFGLKTVIEDEDGLVALSEQNRALIFAFNPHDVLPYGVFAFNPSLKRLRGKLGSQGCCLMTSAVFRVPLLKHVYSWVRGLPVDKATFKGRLERGESLTFSPGGVQEVLMLDPKNPQRISIYLRPRKGFIKLALLNGSPIVPVFGFGFDGSYTPVVPKGKVVMFLSRRLGAVPLFYLGRWNIPFGIPRPHKITVCIGKAIDVPKIECPTSELIENYREIFLKELDALFHRHKESAGYGDRTLKIH